MLAKLLLLLMAKLVISKFGRVDEGFLKEVLEVIEECYNRFKDLEPNLVDLYVFEKASTMEAFIAKEKENLKILTSPFEESFFATHDAWYGTPRITVCIEKIGSLPKNVVVGGLRHEIAHTILHGSPEYYLLILPKPLKKAGKILKITDKTVNDILYLISIAVKDYEVTRLLYNGGYVKDQVAYCKHYLKPTFEEESIWEIAKAKSLTKFVFLTSILKNICCAAPLLKDKNYRLEIKKEMDKSLSYLPEKLALKVFEVVEETEKFGSDTQKNIEFFSQVVVEKLLNPLLSQ